MEAARDHRLHQSKLVRVVVVEGRPVHGCSFRDVLHGYFIETLVPQEGIECPLQELSGAPDSRIANFTVRNWHGRSIRGYQGRKRIDKTTSVVYTLNNMRGIPNACCFRGDICRHSYKSIQAPS